MTTKSVREMAALLQKIARSDAPAAPFDRFRSLYERCSREDRRRLFDLLLRNVEVKRSKVESSLRAVVDAGEVDPAKWSVLLTGLRHTLESPRLRAFRRFLNVSGGLPFLLAFRTDVVAAQRDGAMDLAPLDEEIAYLFNSWFQHGFLFLQEITQDSSYRQIRFLKEHELVHPMASLEEMGGRLGRDRRLFALFHRAMPEEPIVFIEVALTRRMVRSIHAILEHRDESAPFVPDTAVFYSINNTQNSLAGLGLGKTLIFQVVDAIKKDYPKIRTFTTLSPIPGFWERYLRPVLEGDDGSFRLKKARAVKLLGAGAPSSIRGRDLARTFIEILSTHDWIEHAPTARWLKRPLTELCFFYLTQEKNGHDKPLNPVASFHLGNGARLTLSHVNFGANRSERGLRDSCGMMVNYVYSSTWLHQIRRTARSFLSWENERT